MQRPQSTIVMFLVVMAIILATGTFLALSYIQRRPEAPAGTFTTIVEGVEVTVRMDPEQAVRILSPEEVGVIPQPETQGQAPTAAPPEAQPTQVVQAPANTVAPPTATTAPLPPPPTAAPNAIIFESYTVQAGDTLYGIAKARVTSITLMARHGIAQDNLVPGNVIQIPAGNPAYCPGRRPYAVGEGDTSFSIARKFGTTAENIQNINGLDANYTVYAASIICVP